MEKTEFLDQLRMSLNGKLEPQDVNENLRYYEDYINTQVRMGRRESEVMEALGSPRLIARTITDANGIATQEYEEQVQEQSEQQERKRFSGIAKILAKFFLLPQWARTLISVFAVLLILSLAFTILKALLPIIIILLIVAFMAKFFRDLK